MSRDSTQKWNLLKPDFETNYRRWILKISCSLLQKHPKQDLPIASIIFFVDELKQNGIWESMLEALFTSIWLPDIMYLPCYIKFADLFKYFPWQYYYSIRFLGNLHRNLKLIFLLSTLFFHFKVGYRQSLLQYLEFLFFNLWT